MVSTQVDPAKPAPLAPRVKQKQPPFWIYLWMKALRGWQQGLITWVLSKFNIFFSFVIHKTHLAARIDWLSTHVVVPLLAFVTGSWRSKVKNEDGKPSEDDLPISLINNTDPTFSIPTYDDGTRLYDPAEFPVFFFEHERGTVIVPPDYNGFEEWVAHMLALMMKVAYEHSRIVVDVLQEWGGGWRMVKSFTTANDDMSVGQRGQVIYEQRRAREGVDDGRVLTPGCDTETAKRQAAADAAKFIPQTHAYLLANDHALVIVFRGTEPTNLVQWASDGTFDFVTETNVHGNVHGGFYDALFYKATEEGTSIFEDICTEVLQELKANPAAKVYVTGHSLGGALASVFAHTVAHEKSPDYANEVFENLAAVYTWAGPLVGDLEFISYMKKRYRNKGLFRVVHSADLVPKIPPVALGFRHHESEYLITAYGAVLDDPQEIQLWDGVERSLYWQFQVYKLVGNFGGWGPTGPSLFWRSNTAWWIRALLRTVYRVVLAITRLNDHWPSDYENKMRTTAFDLARYLDAAVQNTTPATGLMMMSRTEISRQEPLRWLTPPLPAANGLPPGQQSTVAPSAAFSTTTSSDPPKKNN